MGPRLVFSAGEVPEIPASRLSLIANAREPLLFWVHTGHAELQIGDRTRSVTAGAATWVPAGIAYSIRVDPGAVAFPIPMPAADLPPTLNRIIDFEIPAAWQDWLVHQFAHNLGFLRGGATVGGRTTRACRGGPIPTTPTLRCRTPHRICHARPRPSRSLARFYGRQPTTRSFPSSPGNSRSASAPCSADSRRRRGCLSRVGAPRPGSRQQSHT